MILLLVLASMAWKSVSATWLFQFVTDWFGPLTSVPFLYRGSRTGNKINAVLAANDGIAGSVVSALESAKLPAIPLTGQDATPGGLQYILAGWQSGTVYKPVPVEAAAAARVAIDMIKGKPVATNGVTSNGIRKVPSVLETPIWITKANYKLLFNSGFLKRSQVCVGQYKKLCGPAV